MASEQDIGPTFILGLSALLLSAFFIARHVYLSNHPLDAELTAKVTTSQRTLVEASREIAPPVDPAAQRQVLGHVYECVINGQS